VYNPAGIMLANLRALLGVIIDIILLRRGPESVPASQVLLAFVMALNIGGALLLGRVDADSLGQALAQSVVGCAVLLAWFHAALIIARKRERYLQTMTALFAVNALFLPAVIPMYTALMPYLEKADPANPPPAALLLLALALSIWVLVIQVRIVRAAFECPWLGAFLLMIGEIFFAGMVSMLFFGSAEKVT